LSRELLLLVGALLAGLLNSLVGGGTFIGFPALVFYGVPPLQANATNSFAMTPTAIAGAIAYRKDLDQPKEQRWIIALASVIGGAVGGALLLLTPERRFSSLVPWLLLFATTIYSFGGRIQARLASKGSRGGHTATAVLQLLVAIYGGYFGGGMGIMMLAAWSLLGMKNINAMNGLRSIASALINGVAVIAFVIAGAISWRPGLIMAVGATTSGYLGAAMARKVDPKWVRRSVVVIAWVMTATFFASECGLSSAVITRTLHL
jgi:uncharacterized membrane protein YfcA